VTHRAGQVASRESRKAGPDVQDSMAAANIGVRRGTVEHLGKGELQLTKALCATLLSSRT
jgi:hypothetical protein